jgi:hypothetical protein
MVVDVPSQVVGGLIYGDSETSNQVSLNVLVRFP